MNSTSQDGKICNFEKTYPGCLGRMVNLFELNIGVSANRLLSDKPHQNGSTVLRSRSDGSTMSPSADQIEDKEVVAEFKNAFSDGKLNGTPMKMLIAEEMSKEVDSRRSPPNLVAKLMGLDALPQQEPESAMDSSLFKGHSRSHSEITMSKWEQQNGFFNYVDPNEYKDVYEVRQLSQKFTHKGRYEETINEEKMALVCQKFAEAKCLSMVEKLRQSKQFHAVEVLNSDKDLFLKYLQEPNSVLSQQHTLQSMPPHSDTKRITVLRPTKMAEGNTLAGARNKGRKQMKMGTFIHLNGVDKSHMGSSPPTAWTNYKNPTQPTRIVVLKPSLRQKAVGFPPSQSARIHGEDCFGDVEDNENKESREVGKAITQHMQEKLGRHWRHETLPSSMLPDDYIADENSFHRSEIEDQAGNISDSEVMSPLSRHSWDNVNRLGSPCPSLSFSRASNSPESSVSREAKKRLSERWAMMASNGSCRQQRRVWKSSNTLGEMLALSEAKKISIPGEEDSSTEGLKNSNSFLGSGQKANENADSSPSHLMRSKSIPVSCTQFVTRHNADVSVSDKGKQEAPKEDVKARSVKSSFKGKVSGLIFSRNKKTNKVNSVTSKTDELHSTVCFTNKGPHLSPSGMLEPSNKASFSNLIAKQGVVSHEVGLSIAKPIASGNPGDNQDQPSPISVLDPPFEENEHTAKVFSHFVKPDLHGFGFPHNPTSSNLIDKSPLIGSISRTISWDDLCLDTDSSYPIKEPLVTQGTEEEEREWFFFVETLLSVAGLQGEMQSSSLLPRLYSPESPLNPSLRDKYIDLKNYNETLHEAKRRQKRSMQKLVFDCVNAALAHIVGYGSDFGQRPVECINPNNSTLDNALKPTVLDEVWAQMITWLSSESRCVLGDCGDDNSPVVEIVRKEVTGKGWIESLKLETDNLGREIEEKLLQELVQETVAEFTGRT